MLADGRVMDVANVVWATGFRRDFSWIRLPVFDANGEPLHHRGVVRSEPGLYFVGLPFQSSMLSGLVAGAGPDARYVVQTLVARTRITTAQRWPVGVNGFACPPRYGRPAGHSSTTSNEAERLADAH